jgi:hypothetical protein
MSVKPDIQEIVIDGKTYVPKESISLNLSGNIKIVILQRGWVMVGILERNGSDCVLRNASVIRVWGTTRGLGEIAKNGPTKDTKLDKTYGIVEFDYLTVVASVSCSEDVWKKEL